jgi:hypothetical protein
MGEKFQGDGREDADLVESEVKSDERLLAEEKAKRYASRDWIDRI